MQPATAVAAPVTAATTVVFARPGAWRVLDAAIALVMVVLALGLLRGG